MANLADDSELEKAREAAHGGDPRALNLVGRLLGERGLLDEAEPYFRAAADAGYGSAMKNLGTVYMRRQDLTQAEEWFRRADDAGDAKGAIALAGIASNRGDKTEAERLLRRATETGSFLAMAALGGFLRGEGKDHEAEAWLRKAVDGGETRAFRELADLLRRRVDSESQVEAEHYYRQAADLGDGKAMNRLGYALLERGEVREAIDWYRRGIAVGQSAPWAVYNLGLALRSLGEYEQAEPYLREAAEAGNAHAMGMVGLLVQNKGAVGEAEDWFCRAVAAGDERAAEALGNLQKKVAEIDPWLDAVEFDTFGWRLSENQGDRRVWRGEHSWLGERYVPVALPPEIWNEEVMREAAAQLPTFIHDAQVDGLELPEEYESLRPPRLPDDAASIDIELFTIDHAKAVSSVHRHRIDNHIHYSATVTILFRSCFWALGLELEEHGALAGEREGIVARYLLDDPASSPSKPEAFDPYDRRWDGLAPLENDPLTCLRILLVEFRKSIKLGTKLAALEPFSPSTND